MPKRPPIPADVKRSVRKRCGYGCIICGKPIYEYHHIEGFVEKIGHVESEITILCDTCHRKTTNGIFSRDAIVAADTNPFNRRRSTPDVVWMHYGGNCQVVLGNNVVEFAEMPSAAALVMDGNPICFMEKEDDYWLLSLKIYDEHDRPLLAVSSNELIYRTSDVEDVCYQGGVLTIRRNGRICFRAGFKPPALRIMEAETWWNGIHLNLTADGLLINQRPALDNCKAVNCSVAFIVGRDPFAWGCGARLGAPTRLIYLLGNDELSPFPEDLIPIKPWESAGELFDRPAHTAACAQQGFTFFISLPF